MNGIYYIENTIDERATAISGYFPTLDEAKEALKNCNDWYVSKPSGCIYYVEFGLGGKKELVYKL